MDNSILSSLHFVDSLCLQNYLHTMTGGIATRSGVRGQGSGVRGQGSGVRGYDEA